MKKNEPVTRGNHKSKSAQGYIKQKDPAYTNSEVKAASLNSDPKPSTWTMHVTSGEHCS